MVTGRRLSSYCLELVEKERRNGTPLISVYAVYQRVVNALSISMGIVYNMKQKKEATSTVPSSSTSTGL
ncbi:hypothetical protein Trydic_g13637 [Trypoxylus dichotomus]